MFKDRCCDGHTVVGRGSAAELVEQHKRSEERSQNKSCVSIFLMQSCFSKTKELNFNKTNIRIKLILKLRDTVDFFIFVL